jgi:GrpB-like predicted nucleotidyltransferase (UPF0157 family)
MPERVIIVPYNPEWPAWFAQIKTFVETALVSVAHTIEHVGSTSIPGMMAKPIIDTDIIVDRPVFPTVKDRLAEIGYLHQGDLGLSDREAFTLIDPHTIDVLPTHHLYVCITGACELRKHLLFRDYLRTHDSDAQAYATLKSRLADQFGDDREGYTEAKSEFIMGIMRKAEQWADQPGIATDRAVSLND